MSLSGAVELGIIALIAAIVITAKYIAKAHAIMADNNTFTDVLKNG